MKIRHILILAAGMLLYFMVNFQRTAVPGAIFNDLQSELQVSAGYITALGSSFMYIYAMCQLLTGLMVDRYGGFRTIIVGGLLFTIGSLCFPFCKNLWMMYAFRFFTGLGASCVYLSMIKEIMRFDQKRFTTIFGFCMLIGYAGSIAAGAPFVSLIQHCYWRTLLAGIGLIITAVYVSFTSMAATFPKQPINKQVHFSIFPILNVFKNRNNIKFMTFASINWGLYYSLLTVIGIKYLEDYCKMSPMKATTVITIMGGLSAGYNCLSGILSTLWGNRRRPFVMFASISSALCYILMCIALVTGFKHPVLCVLFLVITLTASQSPITVAIYQELNPPESAGITQATSNFVSYMMVAIFSNICGFLLEVYPSTLVDGIKIYGANSYLLYFAFAAVTSIIGVIAVHSLPETGHKE